MSRGYGFRLFGAEMFRATGQIPEWNPYLFGGLPFIAAQHGDIFYPTAWLRWFLPIDTAMNLGFFAHIVLAGATMYAFLRALRVSWTGAVVGGLAYELTGIVASLVRPGHDGKLFVSALAPLVFLALLRAIRDRRPWGYGLLALTVGLCMLSPHYQMTYYLLVAAAALDALSRLSAIPTARRDCAGRWSSAWPSAPCSSGLASRRSRCCRFSSTSRSRRAAPADRAEAGTTPPLLDAARGADDDGAAAVQRRAGRTTGAATSSSSTPSISARSSWCSPPSASATGAGGGWCRRSASSRFCSCWSRSAATRRSTICGTK